MLLSILAVALLAACAHAPSDGQKFVLVSSTIGPIDAGIVPLLEERFEIEPGIRARHVGAGTGAALEIAKQGTVDLVLVHARAQEEKYGQPLFFPNSDQWRAAHPAGK
jgi:tungstate transport system substrate-binding protein